ncbi:antibiotic biosynthesis monooxygenase family protein [Acidovorax sp. SDU_ACID1]|uniref:antibiotic biosynthesis monooxygenase family protein n=1 Tax=Acidovorax sp. SDU_ACID1 TaxID=3136632 RepID=UPI0038738E43
MFSSTFIFAKKEFDDEFHVLDQAIACKARSIAGYLGEEAWENPATGIICNVYYWNSLEALQELVRDPTHQLAKAKQEKWLDGFRVVISEVHHEYGQKGLGLLPHGATTSAG